MESHHLAYNILLGRPKFLIGGKMFKLGQSLSIELRDQIFEVITRHLDAFAWSAADMPDIDPDFLCHHLTMDPSVRPVCQRRRNFNEEKRQVIREETTKLLKGGHIREIDMIPIAR